MTCSECEGHGYFLRRYYSVIAHHAYKMRCIYLPKSFDYFPHLTPGSSLSSVINPALSRDILSFSIVSEEARFIPHLNEDDIDDSPFASKLFELLQEVRAKSDTHNHGTVVQFGYAIILELYVVKYSVEKPKSSNNEPNKTEDYDIIVDKSGEYYYSETDPAKAFGKKIFEENIQKSLYPFLNRMFYKSCTTLLQSKFLPAFERGSL
ncbi:MAG: hypothetical protein QXM92_04045 [Candidatus Anstonellales archaeon]